MAGKRPAQELLTTRQVAAELGVSESTVWRMLRAGDLVGVRERGRRLVPRSALERRVRTAPSPTIPALGEDHPLWRLVGAWRSRGGPGSSDKYGALFDA